MFLIISQHVPIPSVESSCKLHCCSRRFIPLNLAYARTIHRFQGLTAGPVDDGKIPNMYHCIICDPDQKHFEASALGLLYTALSRATTLGDDNGLNSAIYFTGVNFKEDRIRNPCNKKGTTKAFEKAIHRTAWVKYLTQQTTRTSAWVLQNIKNENFYLDWATNTHMNAEDLHVIVNDYVQQLFLYHYHRQP